MSENLSKKMLKEALKNLKSSLDEEEHSLPLVAKVPLAGEMEHKNWLKRMAAFAKQRWVYHRRRAKNHPWEYPDLSKRE